MAPSAGVLCGNGAYIDTKMGVNQEVQRTINTMRSEELEEGDPRVAKGRKVQMHNGMSPMINLTDYARDKFKLDQGMEMRVEVYDDGIFIRPKK